MYTMDQHGLKPWHWPKNLFFFKMEIPTVFKEMLQELGLEPKSEDPIELKVDPEKCPQCDIPYELDLNDQMGCFECGMESHLRVYIHQELNYNNERTVFGRMLPKGNSSHITYTRRRGYTPLTHFKEHLRRYMGYRFSEDPVTKCLKPFPPDLIELIQTKVELVHPDAYAQTRKVLKKYPKGSKFHKDTFQLIYEAGGIRPHFDHKLFERCVRKFMQFQHAFSQTRDQYDRKNLPCYHMLLDLILTELGHKPHYLFPKLKDEILASKVLKIFTEINRK